MIKNILLLTLAILLAAEDNFDNSFITQYEYGKMLYENPRGISCVKCHGNKAQGKVISTFKHIKAKKEYKCSIISTDITNISYELFHITLDPKLKKPKKKFNKEEVCEKLTYGNSMPTYFLTKEELNSIYYYLTNLKNYE